MKYTVLAVDDVLENLLIVEQILKDTYDVVTVESGAEALKVLPDVKPDLILLDLSMPDMDGFELLEHIREDKAYDGIPAIFVTMADDVYSEEKALKLGAMDYIKKPYEPNVIRVKVHNHIELKVLRDNLEAAVAERTKELEERTQHVVEAHGATIMGMSMLSESRDKITGAHLLRIKNLTEILATRFMHMFPEILDNETAETIIMYSPLHDIGKVSVPDAVLTKKGRLTNEEFDQMKAHAKDGGTLLRELVKMIPSEREHLRIAIEIAEGHHERFDGTGYPGKVAGENIPLSARIVAIADIYDALRSPRPYKPGFTHEEAMNIILEGDGRTEPTHFDPNVLRVFRSTHKALCIAYDRNPDPNVFDAINRE